MRAGRRMVARVIVQLAPDRKHPVLEVIGTTIGTQNCTGTRPMVMGVERSS